MSDVRTLYRINSAAINGKLYNKLINNLHSFIYSLFFNFAIRIAMRKYRTHADGVYVYIFDGNFKTYSTV